MDKKRKKAKLKLGKNKLVILEDSIDFDPKSHCLIACNAGQKCGVDQKFLKSAPLLATSSESEILQPKNETFAVILVDQIDPEFLTKPVVFELPKNQQNPTIYFFLSPIQTFKKFEKLAKFPSGLELVENFVTDLQAQQIINFVNLRLVEIEENPDNFKSHHYNFLKNRSVLHFQHNFDYDVNGSTTDISQDYPMPEFLSKILTTQPDIFHTRRRGSDLLTFRVKNDEITQILGKV